MSNESATLGSVMHIAIEKHGVNPLALYCLVTGKVIGESNEFQRLVESLTGDIEAMADECVMRCLASMRPSILWNRLRVETLDQMRVAAPVETMCFLLNRLMTPSKDQKDVSFQELHRNRIRLYAHVANAFEATPTDAWNRAMLALLTVEARIDLRTQESPIFYTNLLMADSPIESIADTLEKWAARRIEHFDAEEADARFYAANPGARRAALTLFWEVKPKSESTLKRESKQRDANTLGAMLDELLTPGISQTKPESRRPEMPTNIKTVARPSTKMPMRFGVKQVEA